MFGVSQHAPQVLLAIALVLGAGREPYFQTFEECLCQNHPFLGYVLFDIKKPGVI